jgi:hypothetical protein
MRTRIVMIAGVLAAVALAAWCIFDVLGGVFFYTTQGDLCSGFAKRLAREQGHATDPSLEVCCLRDDAVYRAFIAELVGASGLGAFAIRTYLRSRRGQRVR